jgi:transposase InsO family protein
MAEPVNHKCVQRLMQKMGLRALIRAKKRSRNVPGVSDVHVPNVLQRNFLASAPNQKWATDITEFNVNGHKLYLSACMDLYNGEIIAHRMARRPVFELVSGTLAAASFTDEAYRRTDRAFGSGVALQNAALSGDACTARSHAKHEPQGQLS